MFASSDGRVFLRTPWPWLGAGIALAVFAPNFIWNLDAPAGAMGFQSSRVFNIHPRWWYLPQFLAEQLALASPFIALLAGCGLWQATRSSGRQFLIAALLWPTLVFFSLYALQNRVHRNWIDVVYPIAAVAAAAAVRSRQGPQFVRTAAVPVAAGMIAAGYGVLPLLDVVFRQDPLNQHLAFDMKPLVDPVLQALAETKARGIVTLSYHTTGWVRFHVRAPVPVIQVGQEYRYPTAPSATAADLAGTLLFVHAPVTPLDMARLRMFSEIEPLPGTPVPCQRGPHPPLCFYRLGGFNGAPVGKIP